MLTFCSALFLLMEAVEWKSCCEEKFMRAKSFHETVTTRREECRDGHKKFK